jgi:hypothetical protein
VSALVNARPGDIFRSSDGRLWKCTWYCAEPTIGLEELRTGTEIRETFVSDAQGARFAPADELSGGIYGLMWEGFTKLEPKP